MWIGMWHKKRKKSKCKIQGQGSSQCKIFDLTYVCSSPTSVRLGFLQLGRFCGGRESRFVMVPLTCAIWLNDNVTCGVLKIILQSSQCSSLVRLFAVLIASLYPGFWGRGGDDSL
ncbi:uncharacterized protein BDW70DRAFT_124375 [Aspergillus foveolatus]|uniref:uncharacterized protein n=1 Tax=Aspergillus foveolatus TaxID=210207 RepID=UPI003CCD0614